MKTITSKELLTNHAAILKDVRAGQEYQVTFHRKPVARIVPEAKSATPKRPMPGSREAVLESLKHTITSTGDLHDLSYKELRARMIEDKYGR